MSGRRCSSRISPPIGSARSSAGCRRKNAASIRTSSATSPPGHTRLRRLMNKAFTPRAVAGLRPKIQGIVDDLIDRVASSGAMDAIADFAYPIPASVIMVMLGVPRRDLDEVKRWSDDMALFVGSSRLSADKYRRAQSGMREMAEYFRAVIASRRAA